LDRLRMYCVLPCILTRAGCWIACPPWLILDRNSGKFRAAHLHRFMCRLAVPLPRVARMRMIVVGQSLRRSAISAMGHFAIIL
jgi:hypothetical protein